MKTLNNLQKGDLVYFLHIQPNSKKRNKFTLSVHQVFEINTHETFTRIGFYGYRAFNFYPSDIYEPYVVVSTFESDITIIIPYDIDCSATYIRRLGMKYLKSYFETQIGTCKKRIQNAKTRYDASIKANNEHIQRYSQKIDEMLFIDCDIKKQITKINEMKKCGCFS